MELNEYQRLARRTENPKVVGINALLNGVLGLAGESGELADHVKKHKFHGHDLSMEYIINEAGDALWYIQQIAGAAGITLDQLAQANISKLKLRYPEGFSEEASRNRTI